MFGGYWFQECWQYILAQNEGIYTLLKDKTDICKKENNLSEVHTFKENITIVVFQEVS